MFRALGNGLRVGIVQFVKGKWETGERTALEKFGDQVTIKAMGEGFTWDTQDRARDIAAAKAAWEKAKEMIEACRGPANSKEDRTYDMILLDELNIVLRYDYLPPSIWAPRMITPSSRSSTIARRCCTPS